MIVDARRSNLHFRVPGPIPLATGSGLSSIELGCGSSDVFVGHLNLKDAFYHLQLPMQLRHLFGLRPLGFPRFRVFTCMLVLTFFHVCL